jgi:hypothetical protein
MMSPTMLQITRKLLHGSCAAIVLSSMVNLPAQAASITYSGDTTDASTFNRPATSGFEGLNDSLTTLSSIGTAVPYFSQAFSVDTSGSYDVVGTQAFDGVQYLYQAFFNPASPLINLLAGNDPFPDVGNAGFNGLPLIADT